MHPWLWPWGNQRVKTHRTEYPGATWEKENEQKGEMGAEKQVGSSSSWQGHCGWSDLCAKV